jgi:surface antigen
VSDILLNRSSCRARYSGTARPRLWRGTFAAAVVGVALGGCSIDLNSISLPKPDLSDITGAIKRPTDAQASAQLPPEPDLALTRAAVNEVLRGGNNASVPWENQATGARGTVTALASAYTVDKTQCRDFLASYVAGGKESWLRGEACREDRGSWQVRALKPWVRS